MKEQLAGIYCQIALLDYRHREGGRYCYVKLLSLLRELRELIPDREEILILSCQINDALCHNFGPGEEKFFEESRKKLLYLLRQIYRGREEGKMIAS